MSRTDEFTIVPYPAMRLGEALINNYEMYFELRDSRKLLARIALADCGRKIKGNKMDIAVPPLTFDAACTVNSMWLVAYGCGTWWQIHDAFADNVAKPFRIAAGTSFVVDCFPITLT